jgi:hypothetical protein
MIDTPQSACILYKIAVNAKWPLADASAVRCARAMTISAQTTEGSIRCRPPHPARDGPHLARRGAPDRGGGDQAESERQ